MKKLTYLVSAIAAAFTANAYADVSVSGSGSAAYVNDQTGDGEIVMGSSVVFGLSTTTANGIGISTALSLTVTPSAENAASAGGGQTLTFATGGATIVVGDITIADTPGSVGGVASGTTADNGAFDMNVDGGFDDDDGTGVSISTAAGGATISIGYVIDTDSDSQVNVTDADTGATSFGISMPMGAITVNAGVADADSGESAAGASASMALGAGTLTVGYSSQTMISDAAITTSEFTFSSQAGLVTTTAAVTDQDIGVNGDTEVIGATYSMSLDADTTVAVGWQSMKDPDSHSQTQVDMKLSRSLGGGASVYVDMRSLSGDADSNGDGSAFGFGTSVAF
jgi:hypothetical protein